MIESPERLNDLTNYSVNHGYQLSSGSVNGMTRVKVILLNNYYIKL